MPDGQTVGEGDAEESRGRRRRHANIGSVQIEPAPKKISANVPRKLPRDQFFAIVAVHSIILRAKKGKRAPIRNGCILAGNAEQNASLCEADGRITGEYP